MIYSLGLQFFDYVSYKTSNLDTYRWGSDQPFISETDKIPPFQLAIPIGGTITATLNGSPIDLTLSGMRIEPKGDHDVIVYPGNVALSLGTTIGDFELVINDGTADYYAETFRMCDVTNFIKVTYKHGGDYGISTSSLDYFFPYTLNHENVMYINSDIVKPEYIFSRDVTNRASTILPRLNTYYKLHRFHFMATEAKLDQLAHIVLHDCVTVAYNGREYDTEEFLMTPEWDDYAFYAGVDVEFKTSAVSVVAGRGYDRDICAPEFSVEGLCNITDVKGPYADIDAAVADGVIAGEYFDLTDDNNHGSLGVIFLMNPTVSYQNDIIAEAAVGKDACFALNQFNDFGYSLTATTGQWAGIMMIAPELVDTYSSDFNAQAGNKAVDDVYFLRNGSLGNETFLRVLRDESISINGITVGACSPSGSHAVTVNISYVGLSTIKILTAGKIETVNLDGSGELIYTVNGVTCNGQTRTLSVENIAGDVTATSFYTSPLSTSPIIGTGGIWSLNVTSPTVPVSNIACESYATPPASVRLIFSGTSPVLQSITVDTTSLTTTSYDANVGGYYYYITITASPSSIQVVLEGDIVTGVVSMLLTDASTGFVLISTPC